MGLLFLAIGKYRTYLDAHNVVVESPFFLLGGFALLITGLVGTCSMAMFQLYHWIFDKE